MKNKRNCVLTEARKKLNLNQEEFAEQIGTSKTFYNGMECLKNFPGEKFREKISKYFIDKGIYLFEEDLFPKELYFKKPSIEFLSLEEIKENEIPCEENQILEDINSEHMKNGIGRVLNILGDREKKVLIDYFGINENEEAKSLEEISETLEKKVTYERVRQIKNRALKECLYCGFTGYDSSKYKKFLRDYLID